MKTRITNIYKSFVENEKSSGLTLIFFTLLSLFITNSSLHDQYIHLWENKIGGLTLELWINDVLMSVFFLLVGLELKREFKVGELSSRKRAILPIFSAMGGMLVPALIYMFFNNGTPTANGFGVPMATDIAFALGALTLLGNKVPLALRIFLTALAVIDDLGAIVVIAIFYPQNGGIEWHSLYVALGIFGVLLALNKFKVKSLLVYIPLGVVMWIFMHHSGVHATIAGVLLAFSIPSGTGTGKSPAETLERSLHIPVPFIILPLFALANTAVTIGSDWDTHLLEPESIGVFLGLVLGKPIGITIFSLIAIKSKLAEMPQKTTWSQLFGAGILGGIGFTMSIFVTNLAFDDHTIINNVKFIILLSSSTAGFLGISWLKIVLKKR